MVTLNLDDYKEFMSISDVAEYLGIHANTVRSYLRQAKKPLPKIKINDRKIYVKKEHLKTWLEDKKK